MDQYQTIRRIVGGALLDVAVKSQLPSLLPIRRIVRIDSGPRVQGAEKGVLRWIDYDSYVPGPDH